MKFHTYDTGKDSDSLLQHGYQLYQANKDNDDEDDEDRNEQNTAVILQDLEDTEDNQNIHLVHHRPLKEIETKVYELEAAQNLHHNYVDNNYWKVNVDNDLDELLKDYEWGKTSQ